MSFDGDLLIKGNGGDGVGARVPEAAPVHDTVVAEERAPARDWAVVGDRDVGHADALSDGAVLAARNLREECCQRQQCEGVSASAEEDDERRPLEAERDVASARE